MDIQKHIVDKRVSTIVEENPDYFKDRDEGKNISLAFLLLGVSSYLNCDLDEAKAYITEGGADAGIDAIHIEEPSDDYFTVTVFQAKYTRKLESDRAFPANAILTMVNAIKVIFNSSSTFPVNPEVQAKIVEIQSLIGDGCIPNVRCVFLSNGKKWEKDGDAHINDAGFPEEQVVFDFFNHEDIVRRFQFGEDVDTTVLLAGDAIVEEFNYRRVLIGKVSVTTIYDLMEQHGDSLLERNIRKYLGTHRNRVNTDIHDTLCNSETRNNFYFFNNGVTVICKQFRHNALARENWQVKIDGMQIINGGQTCKTIQNTLKYKQDEDFSNAFVLFRLYELSESDDSVIADITKATNSQNPVDLRSLKSNDVLQRHLETAVKDLGYTYKRKPDSSSSMTNTIPSSVAAEAVLSVWRKKPHLARFKSKAMFGKHYDEIFKDLNGAQLVIAVLIFRFCDSLRKQESKIGDHPHLPYSHHVMAMLIGNLLLKEQEIKLPGLTHKNFDMVKKTLEEKKEKMHKKSAEKISNTLDGVYKNYRELELRQLSSVFRRGDLIEKLR